MANNILATSIANVPHLAAFDDLAASRFDGLDLSVICVYVVDVAPEPALYYLAKQFNVLGWKGWNLATTVAEKRALIKKAVELKRFAGTPWAIAEAVKAVGFDGAQIIEGVGVNYDGSHVHDGTITYGAGANWANFRVIIDLPAEKAIDGPALEKIKRLIFEYKNARSYLVDISFQTLVSDRLESTDLVDLTIYDGTGAIISNEQF